MRSNRFAILWYNTPEDMLKASMSHREGWPGNLVALGLPEDAEIISVVALPCPGGGEEAFRILIVYSVDVDAEWVRNNPTDRDTLARIRAIANGET